MEFQVHTTTAKRWPVLSKNSPTYFVTGAATYGL
jgi:hypothetical protein